MAYQHVILLQVFLRFDLEHSEREVKALRRLLGSSTKPCMHNSRHMALVVKTAETPEELVDRLRPALEMDNIVDWAAVSVLGNPVGKHGGLSSFVTAINFAFVALNATPTKYLKKSQTLIEPDFRKRTPGQMRVEGRRDRQTPK